MKLTKRQIQIVELLAQGLTAEEVADKLCRALPTIRRHLQLAYERVDARNTTHLVAKAISQGWIQALCLALAVSITATPSIDKMRRPTPRVRMQRIQITRRA